MAPSSNRRRFQRTLPVRHIDIARQVAAEHVRLDRKNVEAVGDNGETCCKAAVPHRYLAVRPVDVFGLYGSLGRKITQVPGSLALELHGTLSDFRLPCQGGEFAEIREAVIITLELGIVKVLQASCEVNFRLSGSHRQVADVGAPTTKNQRSIAPP